MNTTEKKTLLELLSEIPDHRKGNAIKHSLTDVLTIGILAILCNANTFVGMQLFGETHYDELKTVLELPYGIPSHDVFGDIFSRVDAESVARCFELWLSDFQEALKESKSENEQVIAIDGKTIRRSQSEKHRAHHVVTAYSSDFQLVLGQLCTEEKSNEIKAIPQLLKLLTLRGSTVTIDAMGTQRDIAQTIIEKDSDYILALKENQGGLLEMAQYVAEAELADTPQDELLAQHRYAETLEKDHGRIEKRECWLFPDFADETIRRQWAGISGAALIRSTRTVMSTGETSSAFHWYIYSNKSLNATEMLHLQRKHWRIENNLHWMLDVVFHEDNAHVRLGHAAVILNMFRKLCLQLLKSDTSVKGSIQSKRLRCAWDFNFALSVVLNHDVSRS